MRPSGGNRSVQASTTGIRSHSLVKREIPQPATQSQLAPAGEGAAERHLVGVLKVPADGEAAGQRRHPDRQVLDLGRDEQGRRLARGVRVGGDDELLRALVAHPLDELRYAEVFGLHAVQRREGAAEDVVEAAVLGGAFNRTDVVGVLDHADRARVPARVAADLALLRLGEVEAAPARLDPLLHLLERLGEPYGVVFLAPDNVEGNALGAPGSYGGELGELGYEPLYGPGVDRQQVPTSPAGSGRGPRGPRLRRRASCWQAP